MNTSSHGFRWSVLLVFLMLFSLADAKRAQAQYFPFGKNRVQYKDFDWRYIQSKHFDVYYYTTKNYGLASFAAIAEEASLKQIEEDFGHQIADRIQVIIYDSHNDFSETNVVALPTSAEGIGGVTDPFKNRITLPFSGDYEQFRRVLQHELVHAVINDMFYGGNVQSRLSGNALQIPLWFNEGMAEYEASGFDTNTDMYIRDAIINDYLAPLQRLQGYYAYRGGQSFWNYIVEEYGRSKITEIFQNLKNLRNLEGAFKRSLGLSLEELSKDWKKYYRKRYLPEVANREDIDEFGDLLTEHGKTGRYNTSPAYSPQGDKIALITNHANAFDVIVINAITGKKLKTLIKGNGNLNFEELNILNPNLSWSPDGSKIALSAKSEGKDQLAIVDYNSGKKKYIAFPNIDAIGSVGWSPDGKKIAFDGNIGSFQDIFVYNLDTQKLTNVTDDVLTDKEPAWGADSKTIYFTSGRGNQLQLDQFKNTVSLLAVDDIYTSDIYAVNIGSRKVQRLTQTPLWNEYQPEVTRDGRLIFISDENGIPNVYQLNLADRTTTPLTNLQTGAQQISISGDGSKLAVNTIHEGELDIYTVSSPFRRAKDGPLKDNHWAKRRAKQPLKKRVPAVGYVKTMAQSKQFVSHKPQGNSFKFKSDTVSSKRVSTLAAKPDSATADTMLAAQKPDTTKPAKHDNNNIDFRNYVFEPEVAQDTTFAKKFLDEDVFAMKDNTTQDDRFIPQEYRLHFSTDIVSAGGGFSTYYGSNGIVQVLFSDLLGDHKIGFGSNLQFDLRNSSYFAQYGNFKHRVNWLYSISHTAYNYRTRGGEALRYRYLSGGITAQYPFNKFQRLDFTLSAINIAQDLSIINQDSVNNQSTTFAYPEITYTNDRSIPGLISPTGGFRYALEVSGSPIGGRSLQFGSVLGDFRKYFDLGRRYSFALRGSGGASFGRDSQTYFLGGVQGWINQQYANANIPIDRFGTSFIAQPAIPLRGFQRFDITGDKFALFNAEFRFPIFAAILPGPIPILPLYNLTGVAFIDAGTAWGQDIEYDSRFIPASQNPYFVNDSDLDFKVRSDETKTVTYTDRNGNIATTELEAPRGDILIGAGFGLRTIVFGLPLRYDIGWPYYRDGFHGNPVNYISIGIDF